MNITDKKIKMDVSQGEFLKLIYVCEAFGISYKLTKNKKVETEPNYGKMEAKKE